MPHTLHIPPAFFKGRLRLTRGDQTNKEPLIRPARPCGEVQEFLDFPPEPPSPLETYRDVVMRARVQACIRALYLPSGVAPWQMKKWGKSFWGSWF